MQYIYDGMTPEGLIIKSMQHFYDAFSKAGIVGRDRLCILLFLSLHRDDVLMDFFSELKEGCSENEVEDLLRSKVKTRGLLKSKVDIEALLLNCVDGLDVTRKGIYHVVISAYSSILVRLKVANFTRILFLLHKIDRVTLKGAYYDIFENILFRLDSPINNGKFSRMLPPELYSFIVKQVQQKDEARVLGLYDHFAGITSVLPTCTYYHGIDDDDVSIALSLLRSLACDRQERTIISPSLNVLQEQVKYDVVFATFPLEMREGDLPWFDYDKHRELLKQGLESLEDDGRLVMLVPQMMIFDHYKRTGINELLLKGGFLEKLIKLPVEILGGLVLLFFTNRRVDELQLINGLGFFSQEQGRGKVLSDIALHRFIEKNDKGVLLRVDKRILVENEYMLDPEYYFQQHRNGTPIGKHIQLVDFEDSNSHLTQSEMIRFVTDSHIKELGVLKATKVKKSSGAFLLGLVKVDKSCLLVSLSNDMPEARYFEYEGVPIYISVAQPYPIYTFVVDNNIEVENFIDVLYSGIFREDSKVHFRNESGGLNLNDFLSLRMDINSLGKQSENVKTGYLKNKKSVVSERRKQELLEKDESEWFNEIASLKHAMGRPKQNILDWSDNMIDFFDENKEKLAMLDEEFVNFYGINIIGALKEVKTDINEISDLMENGESGLRLSSYPLTKISFFQIKDWIESVSDNHSNFDIRRINVPDLVDVNLAINTNISLLSILLNNILTNAEKHAFESFSQGNCVNIEWGQSQEFFILRVANNGKPFPNNFDKRKFVVKFATTNDFSGSGLGGYDINRIAKHLGDDDWKLLLDAKAECPVIFEFKFQIITL